MSQERRHILTFVIMEFTYSSERYEMIQTHQKQKGWCEVEIDGLVLWSTEGDRMQSWMTICSERDGDDYRFWRQVGKSRGGVEREWDKISNTCPNPHPYPTMRHSCRYIFVPFLLLNQTDALQSQDNLIYIWEEKRLTKERRIDLERMGVSFHLPFPTSPRTRFRYTKTWYETKESKWIVR